MNHTDRAIRNLAAVFCALKQHDEQLYVKALQSLVNLAVSEEKVAAALAIERDMEHVRQIFSAGPQLRELQVSNAMEASCRRKGDRRMNLDRHW